MPAALAACCLPGRPMLPGEFGSVGAALQTTPVPRNHEPQHPAGHHRGVARLPRLPRLNFVSGSAGPTSCQTSIP